MMDFGEKLKSLRLQKHMTQEELSVRLGVTKSVISAYENNKRMPSYGILIQLSRTFSVTTDYLFGLEEKHAIYVSGLTDDEILAIVNLAKAMQQRE